jgi:hypothetical protein
MPKNDRPPNVINRAGVVALANPGIAVVLGKIPDLIDS